MSGFAEGWQPSFPLQRVPSGVVRGGVETAEVTPQPSRPAPS
jgi:hypothetical protein